MKQSEDRLQENVQASQAQRHEAENARYVEGELVVCTMLDCTMEGTVQGWVKRSVNNDTGVTVCVKFATNMYRMIDATRVKKAKKKKRARR